MNKKEVIYYNINGVYLKVLYWYGVRVEKIYNQLPVVHYFAVSEYDKGLTEVDSNDLIVSNMVSKKDIPRYNFNRLNRHYKNFMINLDK